MLARWDRWLRNSSVKPVVWLVCLWPFAALVWGVIFDDLGANPAETLIRSSGNWALRWLCVALAVTPARLWLGLPSLGRLRRVLGLFAFFYACLHVLCYVWLEQAWSAAEMWHDLMKRPFILVGALAFSVLLALAATSPRSAVRWMGAKHWQRLHRVVYIAGILAMLHFYWMRTGKNDVTEVGVYAVVMASLLALRFRRRR